MNEGNIEDRLVKKVKELGGECIKIETSSSRGYPDRLVILPYGQIYFVETKVPKDGIVSPYQNYVIEKLVGLNQKVYIASSIKDVDVLIREWSIKLHHIEEGCYGDL